MGKEARQISGGSSISPSDLKLSSHLHLLLPNSPTSQSTFTTKTNKPKTDNGRQRQGLGRTQSPDFPTAGPTSKTLTFPRQETAILTCGLLAYGDAVLGETAIC